MATVTPLSAGGCGNLTAGGATGSVTAAVSGDAPESAGTRETSDPAPVASTGTAVTIEGDVDATLRVQLQNATGEWVAVVAEDTRVVVDTRGQTEVELEGTTLEPGSYPRARVVFTDVFADIETGLVVDGVEVTGRIDVGGGETDSLVVESNSGIQLEAGAEEQILVDLNSPAWLSRVDPLLGIVGADVFESEVAIRAR